ncbi:MAG: ATP-binding cassette domain-containing protein [Bacillus sp. (in: firmicutes)]
MAVIECRELTKIYGRKKALHNLSFSLEENKITGLIGRNGAGKTTLLKIIAGFLKETSGEIKVLSKHPFNSLFVSANTIYIDQEMHLPSALNLGAILEEAERFYQNWDRELAKRLVDYFSLNRAEYHSDLSKGMKSIFNSILGICSRCALTIFDEPINGMDAGARKDFYRALLKDYIAHPRSIIISSHHLDEMEDLLEDILLIKNGQTFFHMPTSDVKEWAIGLRGRSSAVEGFIKNRDILFQKQLGAEHTYVVVKNDFQEEELSVAGIETSPVSASDVCIYVTNQNKGGIDDVFC